MATMATVSQFDEMFKGFIYFDVSKSFKRKRP